MRQRVAAGDQITDVIRDLDRTDRRDQTALACELADHIPTIKTWIDQDETITTDAIALRVATHLKLPYGTYPRARTTRLWEIWRHAPDP